MTLPAAASVAENPSQQELRVWVLELMPNVTKTEFDNLNYKAQVKARLGGSTFFIDDDEEFKPSMSRDEYEKWAAIQDEYIADKDMVLIEGWIGPDEEFRTASRLYMEKTQSNIPAMQQQLFFPKDDGWEPDFTVIYTPGLPAPGKPDDRLIMVDHENYVTRVLGSDYFGESKMGGLRMWNHLVYELGGLACHAGIKAYPDVDGEENLMLILGLSGTGKTTTTFREQLGSLPVQDDFAAVFPGGKVYATENGCFAKTYGLDRDDEPTIYGGTTRPDAWLENTHVEPDGSVDFFDDSDTRNGRSTFPLANIRHRDPRDLPKVDYILLLNRNENIIPALVKLNRDQIGAYFMLGETKGTSAGGAAEAGKSLRVPGTNPFFFTNDALQGNRLLELLETMPDVEVYLMSTGRVGGGEDDPRSKKVEIRHSSTAVQGIVEGTITWKQDPDFGYLIAADLPEFDDPELLQPRLLYERQDRLDEYDAIVAQLGSERSDYLHSFPGLDPAIIAGL